MVTRREVLGGLAAATSALGTVALGGCTSRAVERDFLVPGRMIDSGVGRGHLLRDGLARAFPADAPVLTCDTVIVGAGVAGLAAADALRRAGRADLLVLELADEPGGNAVSGRNAVSAYPWAAHYVPIADPTDEPLCEFLERCGAIRARADDGTPTYEETMLGADPHERLYVRGAWQAGLVPVLGGDPVYTRERARFLACVESLRTAVGDDGRPAFALPVDRSSEDPRFRALDSATFAAWLAREGYSSAPLRWYLDYCCRDDYGGDASSVSAWAGLHYFAARRGRATNATHDDVVTWPEGNAFLTRALAAPLGTRLRTGVAVLRATTVRGRARFEAIDRDGVPLVVEAAAGILAVPSHVLARLLPEARVEAPPHVPWVVANLTLERRPGGRGEDLCWDNVVYGSRLLGYVVADHQRLGAPRDATVVTYYWPLSHRPPADARRWAERRGRDDWLFDVLGELYRVHPELRGRVANADVRVWGHGMACPSPGTCWSPSRASRLASRPPFHFAHTDLSGISVFEEAFALGRRAAAARVQGGA